MILSPIVIATLLLVGSLAQAKPPAELIRLEVLTTTRGKTYKKLTVRDVTPSGIKILHEGGTATLHYEELPADLRERLGGFDPEKAQQYLEEEEKKLKEQQSQIERDLRKMEKEEKDKKPAPDEDEDLTPPPDEDGKPIPSTDEDAGEKPAPVPTPSEKATPASPQDPAKAPVDKGVLTARIIGYKTGVKRVEFRVMTNCDARLKVHNIPPYRHSQTIDISANTPFVREIWVYNDYKSELLALDGKKLDSEEKMQKTETGRLTPAKLR
jgi:hypothetical protein